MSINYQRRDFLRGAFYCGLALGLPKPVLAALGTTQEAFTETLKIRLQTVRVPCFHFFAADEPIQPPWKSERRLQVSDDDGETWRDMTPEQESSFVRRTGIPAHKVRSGEVETRGGNWVRAKVQHDA